MPNVGFYWDAVGHLLYGDDLLLTNFQYASKIKETLRTGGVTHLGLPNTYTLSRVAIRYRLEDVDARLFTKTVLAAIRGWALAQMIVDKLVYAHYERNQWNDKLTLQQVGTMCNGEQRVVEYCKEIIEWRAYE